MSRQLDIEQLLAQWLDEGPIDTADAVFDAAVARVYRQRQRPAWRFLRRELNMNTPVKILLAAAALIIVFGGAIFVGAGSGPSVPIPTTSPPPSPVASASSSSAASAGAVFPQWYPGQPDAAGILPAGDATTQRFVSGSTFSVPAGWVNDIDSSEFYRLFPDTPANEAEFARSDGPAQGIFMGIVDTPGLTPCEAAVGATGSTAAELADSLVANEALVTSERVDLTLGGLTGARVDAYIDPDWTGICTSDPDEPATNDAKDYRGRFIFLDRSIPGRIAMIVDSIHSAEFEAFLTEAMPIVESFDFTP